MRRFWWSMVLSLPLHAAAKSAIIIRCRTKVAEFTIVQQGERLWLNSQALSKSASPEIPIDGSVRFTDSSANALFTFKNQKTVYTVAVARVCPKDPQFWDERRRLCRVILTTTSKASAAQVDECHDTIRHPVDTEALEP